MIDCESEVYTRVSQRLRQAFPDISISGEYVKSPPRFPHVSCEMRDNPVSLKNISSSGVEEMTEPVFEFNIYSNKPTGRKSEAKTIAAVIADTMFSMNFRRTVSTPVPNLEDAAIYRLTARYAGKTDGQLFYGR